VVARLLAISDLHVGFPANRAAIAEITASTEDWLILAGDLGETVEHVRFVFETLRPKFARLIWVPGNHELWTVDPEEDPRPAPERYAALVSLAREFDVTTPEDPYLVWPESIRGQRCVVVPMFVLYDYSFGPDHLRGDREALRAWAAEVGISPADEKYLQCAPYADSASWCDARIRETERRLAEIAIEHGKDAITVLVNHYPLRLEHAVLPKVPRYVPWCGTVRTRDWAERYRAAAVVTGHLHLRSTRMSQATGQAPPVVYHEVAWGYPRERKKGANINAFLRQILPADARIQANLDSMVRTRTVFHKGNPG
jgi:3',5'-cyclic AMP phosphodiesterase CpdA